RTRRAMQIARLVVQRASESFTTPCLIPRNAGVVRQRHCGAEPEVRPEPAWCGAKAPHTSAAELPGDDLYDSTHRPHPVPGVAVHRDKAHHKEERHPRVEQVTGPPRDAFWQEIVLLRTGGDVAIVPEFVAQP